VNVKGESNPSNVRY